GKTSLASSLAKALGRKFVRMALGGVRDEAEIRGHRRTYIGAMPGRIIKAYERAETNNPVILLDEIDKLASDVRGDPASALLEVLDPEQNCHFTDHYLDLPFDLSKTLFIATANWLDPIHPALRDRMEIIELPSYTRTEKLEIAIRHLVPRQLEQHGLVSKQLRFSKPALARLIDDYTRESGCRQLEREIASLTRKSVRKIVSSRGRTKTVKIQPSDLTSFLGPERFRNEMAEKITDCGIVIGLAWTPVGGDILFIEATKVPGKGKLILTGSLGDVMKESAQTAHTLLRSHADTLKISNEDFDKFDVHIHVPAGATPKDGPSAGVTIFTALASLFTERRTRPDLAMTGEISLRGRVLPVGGIKEKILAAHRSGIKRIVISNDNRKDWQEVPEETRKRLKVSFVHNVLEVLPEALLKK
ncbi:endopeptidase La, partial [Verrucomicrobia bacterium]|nr:endopeptidase La [Verrucomicrobiota bacterium]